jgi:hypothetical protein
VSERAVVTVFTLPGPIDVGSAELCLVLVRMIELFDPIVCFLALVPLRAVSTAGDLMAHLRLVRPQWPPLVLFLIVIVRASLQIVTIGVNFARGHLKESEIKKSTKRCF